METDALDEETNTMQMYRYMLDYAREEASYLRTRTDMRASQGPRSASEGYAKVAKIEWKTGDRLDGVMFTYTDGTSRRWGNSTDWNGEYELDLEAGEHIASVKYWETEKRRP